MTSAPASMNWRWASVTISGASMRASADHSGWRKGAPMRASWRPMPPSRRIVVDVAIMEWRSSLLPPRPPKGGEGWGEGVDLGASGFAGERLALADRRAQPVVEVAHAFFLLGAQGATVIGAGREVALGDLADAEILAHDVAIDLDRRLAGRRTLGRNVAEVEVIDEAGLVGADGQDARGVHAVRIDREGHVRIGPEPDPAID